MSGNMEERIDLLLRRWEPGAYWTSDISYGLNEKTPAVNRTLRRMEAAGKVVRVVKGGRAALRLGGLHDPALAQARGGGAAARRVGGCGAGAEKS